MKTLPLLLLASFWSPPLLAQPAAPRPVELIGKATDFYFTKNYNSYYWREDFSFLLKDEKTGKTWRILSREPTPAYDWRMGTTFTDLKPDWKKEPRVKVVGVTGVDRLPATFYTFKLDEPLIATGHVVWVHSSPLPSGREGPGVRGPKLPNAQPPHPQPLSPAGERGENSWKLYNVNNWFHKWSPEADPVIHSHFADKQAPFDIYGFINGQAAPFSKKSRELIEQHKGARMFHGLVRTAKDQKFGYEIELLHLVGPDKGGNGVVFFGDPKKLTMLEKKK